MKLFSKNLSKFYHKTVAIIIVISFVGSMSIHETAKADTLNTLNQGLSWFGLNVSTTPKDEPVEPPELSMKDWVLQRVTAAGLDPDEVEIIINCESKWNSDAMGVNYNHTADLGLWQINSIHKDISNSDKLDYKKATDWAIEKRLKDGHWRAWSCARKLARR